MADGEREAPHSPRLAKKAAADTLVCVLYDTFRPKVVPPEGGEAQWRIGAASTANTWAGGGDLPN